MDWIIYIFSFGHDEYYIVLLQNKDDHLISKYWDIIGYNLF